MFAVNNLSKIYSPEEGMPVEALKKVSLSFGEKGLVFILGKSGSGKSTLLHLMGGLDRPTEGELILNGVSSKNFKAVDYDNYRGEYLGFVFQDYNLLPGFNVAENIALGLELIGRRADNVEEMLALVGLEGMGKRRIMELSGGQRQRVAIARAIAKNPAIIFADEPTGALDEETGKEILSLFKKLSADKLVIIVTHDREFAEEFGDRIIELANGKVISDTGEIRRE